MRIATYNVRNLLDAETALLNGTSAKPDVELRALVGTIDALAADVLLLQEVGGDPALAVVNDRLSRPYPYVATSHGNSDRGIHLAVMSRRPFRLTSHRELELSDARGAPLYEFDTEADAALGRLSPVRFQRDLLRVELELEDAPRLVLFNTHLKSRTNRLWRRLAADVIRAAEVRAMVQVIGAYLATYPGCALVVAGDFNDTRSSAALAPLFDLPLTDPLGEALARRGRNPSTYWPKRRMRLDFLLASPAARTLLVPGSETIHASQRARRASDHYPVSIDLGYTAGGSER